MATTPDAQWEPSRWLKTRWNRCVDTTVRDREMRSLRDGTAARTHAAMLHAARHWDRLRPFGEEILTAAYEADLPVAYSQLLNQLGVSAPNERGVVVRSLLETFPLDDEHWDSDLYEALSAWLSSPDATCDDTTPQHLSTRPSVDVDRLLRSAHSLAPWTAVNAAGHGYIELTDAHLALLVTTTGGALPADGLLRWGHLRDRLSPTHIDRLLHRATRHQIREIADQVLPSDRAKSWSTYAIGELVRSCWTEPTAGEWLTGQYPTAPRVAALRVTLPFRSGVGDGAFPGRPIDRMVYFHGHLFDDAALKRPGVAAVLEHAPLAVLRLALDSSEQNVFSRYLADRHQQHAGPGDLDKAHLAAIAEASNPDTVTELLHVAAALSSTAPAHRP